MRTGFNRIFAIALGLATVSPAFAILPEGDTQPAELQHPTVEAGLPLSSSSVLSLMSKDGQVNLAVDGITVHAIDGDLTAPSKASPATIALAFAQAQYPDQSFQIADVDVSEVASHVRLSQTVNGLEVFATDLSVHVAHDGSVDRIDGTVLPGSDVLNGTSLTAEEASKAARSRLGSGEVLDLRKVVFPAAEGLRTAYAMDLDTGKALWSTVIDAETGEFLYAVDRLHRATGTGKVYTADPLQGEPTVETLTDLGTSGSLKGKWADVRNEDGDEASSADRMFVFETDDTHFDEVNVYFHLNKVHDFHKSLGFSKLDKPIVATVHVGNDFDNAFFNPRSGALSFGDGSRLNDLAKDNTVVYHEYGHAVLHAIRGQMFMGEGGGLHEGYSDYFAGSMTESSVVGAYAGARLSRGNIRDMANTLHYPEDSSSEPHQAGKIWGGSCWDLRKALGKEVTDRIVHQSRFYLPKFRPTFAKAYQGILKADKELYNGSHAAKITEIFTKRGIAGKDETVTIRDFARIHAFNILSSK